MALITHTYTAGPYTAEVHDDNYVELKKDGILIDRPGPWRHHEGARLWAEQAPGARHAADQAPAEPAPTETTEPTP